MGEATKSMQLDCAGVDGQNVCEMSERECKTHIVGVGSNGQKPSVGKIKKTVLSRFYFGHHMFRV